MHVVYECVEVHMCVCMCVGEFCEISKSINVISNMLRSFNTATWEVFKK